MGYTGEPRPACGSAAPRPLVLPARPAPSPVPPRRPPVGRGLLGDHPHVGLLQCRPVPAQVRSHCPPVRPRAAAAASGLDPPPTAGSPAPTAGSPAPTTGSGARGSCGQPRLSAAPTAWRRELATHLVGGAEGPSPAPSRLLHGKPCILSSVVTVNALILEFACKPVSVHTGPSTEADLRMNKRELTDRNEGLATISPPQTTQRLWWFPDLPSPLVLSRHIGKCACRPDLLGGKVWGPAVALAALSVPACPRELPRSLEYGASVP